MTVEKKNWTRILMQKFNNRGDYKYYENLTTWLNTLWIEDMLFNKHRTWNLWFLNKVIIILRFPKAYEASVDFLNTSCLDPLGFLLPKNIWLFCFLFFFHFKRTCRILFYESAIRTNFDIFVVIQIDWPMRFATLLRTLTSIPPGIPHIPQVMFDEQSPIPLISTKRPMTSHLNLYSFSMACVQYSDFLDRVQLLTQKLFKQEYVASRFTSSL